MNKLMALILALIFSSPGLADCTAGLIQVRPEARLHYLDQGAFIQFTEQVNIPSFEDELLIGEELSLYIAPSSEQRFISAGRAYPVVQSRDGRLKLPHVELILSARAYLTTVDDLVKAGRGQLIVCQKQARPREII